MNKPFYIFLYLIHFTNTEIHVQILIYNLDTLTTTLKKIIYLIIYSKK